MLSRSPQAGSWRSVILLPGEPVDTAGWALENRVPLQPTSERQGFIRSEHGSFPSRQACVLSHLSPTALPFVFIFSKMCLSHNPANHEKNEQGVGGDGALRDAWCGRVHWASAALSPGPGPAPRSTPAQGRALPSWEEGDRVASERTLLAPD